MKKYILILMFCLVIVCKIYAQPMSVSQLTSIQSFCSTALTLSLQKVSLEQTPARIVKQFLVSIIMPWIAFLRYTIESIMYIGKLLLSFITMIPLLIALQKYSYVHRETS